jgi:2-amino-4-hydroxy-6-hydroxymethyldihydropteridine diphosphokinase/dihydropteroate synthase
MLVLTYYRLIPGKALDPASPWKVTQDYLNALEPSMPPLTTLTPLAPGMEPIRALQSNRKTQTMAILNVTPDSFSDGGRNFREDNAPEFKFYTDLYRKMAGFIRDGASIIDIGGQTTAPKSVAVSGTEETSRIVPAIELLTNHEPKNFAISIDTYRASVAEAAVRAGAHIINDVSAGQMDPDMLSTMARLGSTVCLMHMRGTPETMNQLTEYPNGLIPTIAKELLERVAEAEAAGIRRWRIILDPGIGFAKTGEQNLEILRRMDELRDWPGLRGLPWLLGSSRKRFIGTYSGVKKADKRQWGTAAAVAASVQGGADIVRVHDVKEMVPVVKVSDAIWRL